MWYKVRARFIKSLAFGVTLGFYPVNFIKIGLAKDFTDCYDLLMGQELGEFYFQSIFP